MYNKPNKLELDSKCRVVSQCVIDTKTAFDSG